MRENLKRKVRVASKQKTRGLGQMALLWKGRLRAGKEEKFGPYPKRCRARARKKERERGVSGEPLILLIMHLREK